MWSCRTGRRVHVGLGRIGIGTKLKLGCKKKEDGALRIGKN